MDKPADKEAMKRVADSIPTPSLDACASVPMRLVMLALAHRQGMDITRWLDQHLRSTLPQGLPPELCDRLFTTAGDSLPAWGRSLRSEEGNVDPSRGYTDRAFWDLVAAMGSEIHFAAKALEVRRSATGGHRLWTGEPPAFAHLIKADGKRQWFEKLAELGPCREYFRVLPQHLRKIEELRNDAPNLQQATDFLLGQLQVAARSKTGLRSAPRILLVGPPAAGKTWWAERVAAALGLPTCHLSMPCVTASFELAGNTSQWGGAKPGKILRAFLDSPSASPIIVLDEIDKVLTRSDYPPGSTLLDLIERSTATRWRDEFYDREFDVSAALIIATANRPDWIDAPLLSRFHRIDVPAPTSDQLPAMVRSVWRHYRKLRADLTLPRGLDGTVVQRIAARASDARSVMRVLDEALGKAVMRGKRIRIVEEDVRHPAPASVVIEQEPGGLH